MWSDFRYALRQWKTGRALIAVVILLLGIGIGANTLIFSFINAAILQPLPVRDPANLFVVEKNRVKQTRPDTACLYRAYEKIRARKDLFSSAVASQVWSPASFQPFDIGGRTKLVSTNIVSPNYFSELGVNAIIGRRLTPADATITSGIPVVISEQFWKSQMDGSRSILGRTLRIKNYPFQIVGVMPKGFHGLDIDRVPNVWMPISAAPIVAPHSGFEDPLDAIQFQILVRLSPGVASAAAAPAILRPLQHTFIAVMRSYYSKRIGNGSITQAQLNAGLRRATQYKIKLQPAGRGISRMRQKFSTALYVLMGAVGLLLLAVCTSVSGMLLAKAEQRKREIAIRVAIGARPARLLRQTFAESLLWTIPSAGLALVFFYLMSPVLVGMLPEERGLLPTYATPQALSVSLDHRVVLFVIAVCLLTIFLSGLGAAWRATRMNVVEDLKQHQQNRRGAFSGIVMVAIQVGISVVLVAGAVLMVKTFWTLQHLNPGFDRAHIVEVDLNPQIAGYSNKRAVTFMRELRGETALLPGVRSVAGAHMGIMQGVGMKTTIAPEGEVLPKKTFLNTNANSVTPGYFRTLGIPLLAGRTLQNTDRNRKPHPVMVNEAFAKKFFPHQNPIGKAIVYGTNGKKAADSIIVGVVGTAKYRSLREKNPPIIYGVPATRAAPILYARTFGDPKPLLGEIRKLIHTRDPNMPIIASATLEQEVESSLWQERLLTLLSGFFAIIALALAAAGIYGALAYSVAARTREIGIRMAIGAQPRDIVRTVCGRLFAGIAAGLIIGTAIAALLLQISQKLFFGVQGFDVTAFLIAIGCILLCAALAALFPAYRAIKTDPVSAMRLE